MRPIQILLLAAVLTLGGCVTPLQPRNYQYDFAVTQLADDRFRVQYSGWSASDDDTIVDLALLRSAEIALQHGYHYFVLVDNDSAEALAQATPPAPDADYVLSGDTRYLVAAPGDDNHVLGLRDSPTGSGYVALFVKASLRAKYALDLSGS